MNTSTAITTTEPQGGQAAIFEGSPEEQLARASQMAKALQSMVEQAGLSRSLGGKKKHLDYEAWLTLGRFFGCSPVTEWTRPIIVKDQIIAWECRVNVVDAQGRVIGGAEGMCGKDEPHWKAKPDYAVRSMAQTRTAGKALRSVFGFVAVLAGYSATPSEEMQGVTPQGRRSAVSPSPSGRATTPTQGMSEPQRKKLWALCMQHGLDRTQAKSFFEEQHIQSVRDASDLIERFPEALQQWRQTQEPEPIDVTPEREPGQDDDLPF